MFKIDDEFNRKIVLFCLNTNTNMEKQFLNLGLKKTNNKCLSMYYDMFTIKACRGTR